jgi:hypothetical protein
MQVICQKCGRDGTIPDATILSNTNPALYHCAYCFGPVAKKETGLSGVGLAAALGLGALAMGGTLYALSQAMKEDREKTALKYALVVRRVFYSFHYGEDAVRASQIRNFGVVEGNRPATDNDWETVKRSGDAAIERWIADQLDGKTCAVILIGSQTANRKWINHEIAAAWNKGIGVFGIYIHNLKDFKGQSKKGSNPFAYVNLNGGKGKPLSEILGTYDPPFTDSKQAYAYIGENLSSWVEAAINQRKS